MTNTENINNLLWKITPQHKVYSWLKDANEKGYGYLIIAYNKKNYHFVPIMCHDMDEVHVWAVYFEQNKAYAQDIIVKNVSENTIRNTFVDPEIYSF